MAWGDAGEDGGWPRLSPGYPPCEVVQFVAELGKVEEKSWMPSSAGMTGGGASDTRFIFRGFVSFLDCFVGPAFAGPPRNDEVAG